jgi:hypothetical protein
MWVQGFKGPPGNEGWFQLRSYAGPDHSKQVSAVLPYDAFSYNLLSALVKGTPIPEIVIFVDKSRFEVRFSECLLVSYQLEEPTLSVQFESKSYAYKTG